MDISLAATDAWTSLITHTRVMLQVVPERRRPTLHNADDEDGRAQARDHKLTVQR